MVPRANLAAIRLMGRLQGFNPINPQLVGKGISHGWKAPNSKTWMVDDGSPEIHRNPHLIQSIHCKISKISKVPDQGASGECQPETRSEVPSHRPASPVPS